MSTPSFWKGVFVSSGWAIFGQPLYVYNVAIAGKGTYNVIYVTTENDSVYAFDADGVNTMALWHDSFINPSKGITPIPGKDIRMRSGDVLGTHYRGSLSPRIICVACD